MKVVILKKDGIREIIKLKGTGSQDQMPEIRKGERYILDANKTYLSDSFKDRLFGDTRVSYYYEDNPIPIWGDGKPTITATELGTKCTRVIKALLSAYGNERIFKYLQFGVCLLILGALIYDIKLNMDNARTLKAIAEFLWQTLGTPANGQGVVP